MTTRSFSSWLAAALGAGLTLAATLTATDAQAHDFRLRAGTSAQGSEWRGDFAGYGSLELGVRFADIAGVYIGGHEGYGIVDDRLLTLVTLGGQVWLDYGRFRPYAKLGFVHQHEESLSVVANDFGSAIFGIGDGIRHRAGGELGLGLDIAVWEREDFELFASVSADARLFPDDLGPLVYAGGGLGVGFNYAL